MEAKNMSFQTYIDALVRLYAFSCASTQVLTRIVLNCCAARIDAPDKAHSTTVPVGLILRNAEVLQT